MVTQLDERTKLIREKSREAIGLAMESRWQEAATVNRELLELDPSDIDASNRLGKALLEAGDCAAAREAFGYTLRIATGNTIAKKNLERIDALGGNIRQASTQRITPQLFIEDSGKTTQVPLLAPAPHEQRSTIAGGTSVELRKQGDTLAVHDGSSGQYLGLLPPLLGARLAKLLQAGNRYEGAVSSNTPEQITVLLRETFQHPSQRNVVSFPTRERIAQPVAEPPRQQDDDDDADAVTAAAAGDWAAEEEDVFSEDLDVDEDDEAIEGEVDDEDDADDEEDK